MEVLWGILGAPFPAYFDPRARPLLERLAAEGRLTLSAIAESPKIIRIPVPPA